ncbi:MAG: radical SAM protein [Oligoflexales bacterium]|nr:radical SAM protein [Oligoflexales bacterium]
MLVTVDTEDLYPWAVALELTLECNMRCLHCGSTAGLSRKGQLSVPEWYAVIDELKGMGTEVFTLSGGEPFLYSSWRDIVSHICKKDVEGRKGKVVFVTNGFAISDDDIDFMNSEGVSQIGISIDGNRQIHDFLRQRPGSFDAVMDLVARCRAKGLSYSMITSFGMKNFQIREEVLEIILDKRPIAWQVQIVNSFGRAGRHQDDVGLDRRMFRTLMHDVRSWKNDHAERIRIMPADCMGYCHKVAEELFDGESWEGCSSGCYVLGIKADGDVVGCLSLQSPEFSAGNVRERSISEIWQDPGSFQNSRVYDTSKARGDCALCEFVSQCRAGCHAIAFSRKGDVYENDLCLYAIERSLNG